MNRKLVARRLGLITVLMAVLLLGTAAPALPAGPLVGSLELVPQAAWAGHATCGAVVDVNLIGALANVGGYETKLSYNSASLDYTSGNVAITDFLTAGGTRNNSTNYTPPPTMPVLEAIGLSDVKWGDYSWPISLPAAPGASAPGNLAMVNLDTVQCGTSTISLSESQVVDVDGNLLALGAEPSATAVVHFQYDVDGSGAVQAIDVSTVLGALNAGVVPQCGDNSYRYDVDDSGSVQAIDVSTVLGALNAGAACPNP